MNPNIKVIRENLWAVNFDYVKAGFIKELTFTKENSDAFITLTDDGKIVLNEADKGAMKYVLPFLKVVMGYPDSLLGTDKGFMLYMKASVPILEKYDYPDIVHALKKKGVYEVKRNGFDTACRWEKSRRKLEKQYKKKHWFLTLIEKIKERMVKNYGNN